MEPVIFLAGEKVYLRPVENSDQAMVYRGKNDPRVRETLFLFYPLSFEEIGREQQSWLSARENVALTICNREDHQAVGQTAYLRIDYISRAAIFYLAIYNPEHWGRGYAGEATRLMTQYGFDTLNFNRIQLHVFCDNIAAVKAYQKAGFQIEGTLREAMYHHDRYCDFYVMGILRRDYYRTV